MSILKTSILILSLFLSSYIYTQGCLIAEYSFSNGSLSDDLGIQNAAINNTALFVTDRQNIRNASISFDDPSDDLNFGTSLGNFQTSNFTISFWIKTSQQTIARIISKRAICNQGNYWTVGIKYGVVEFVVNGDETGNTNYNLQGQSYVSDNLWHHVVVVRKGSRLSMIIDGRIASTSLFGTVININNEAPLKVARDVCTDFGFASAYQGEFDDLRIFGCALSAAFIIEQYTSIIEKRNSNSKHSAYFNADAELLYFKSHNSFYPMQIIVYDAFGRIVLDQRLDLDTEIEFKQASGLYTIVSRSESSDFVQSTKIIVQ